jgi:hypothetical protein
MFDPGTFTYFDLRRRTGSSDISILFPGWKGDGERILVLCPHDDDGVLGAGYVILAALANRAAVHVAIFCDGWAGYSRPEEAGSIVKRRRRETVASYSVLGIPEECIHRLDYPDFSLWPWLGWHVPSGREGTMALVLPRMREIKPTRLLVPNGYREHMDHEAVFRVGTYDGPQVGDAILAEYGLAEPVRSYLQYAVWGDFSPEDALVAGAPAELRANRAIVTSPEVEDRVSLAVGRFESQRQVVASIMDRRRKNRVLGGQALELYLAFAPRPSLDYEPYHRLVAEISQS